MSTTIRSVYLWSEQRVHKRYFSFKLSPFSQHIFPSAVSYTSSYSPDWAAIHTNTHMVLARHSKCFVNDFLNCVYVSFIFYSDYLFSFHLWHSLAVLPRLAYGGCLPGRRHATLFCCVSLPALLFRRIVLMNQTIMDMEQILGAFLWFWEANFVTEESLTQLPWPICSERFKFSAVLTVDLTILMAIH